MKLTALLLAATLGAASAASAQMLTAKPPSDPASQPQTTVASNAKPSADDRIICREDETTGNRIKSRICHSKREWDRMEGNAKQTITDMQERNNTLCPGGSC